MTEQVSKLTIAQPDPLTKGENLEENWNKWKQNFQIFLVASGLSETEKTASALFLHTIGQYGRDIANELELLDVENNSVQQLYEKFDKYCKPKCNLTFVRYQFFNTKQAKQSFDDFLSSLKQKSKNCEFGDLTDSLIMTQIIAGISNKKLQERLFLMEELDFEKTVQECRATELAESYVQFLPGGATQRRPEKKSFEGENKPARNRGEQKLNKVADTKETLENYGIIELPEGPQKTNCKFCGDFHVYGLCPAYGSTCTICGKPNHYANVCQSIPKKTSRNRGEQTLNQAANTMENYGIMELSEGPQAINCKFCGGFHVYGYCPAYGSTCTICGKPNHYANVCQSVPKRSPPRNPNTQPRRDEYQYNQNRRGKKSPEECVIF